MRAGAAAGHRGHFHETAFYGSDEEFLAVVAPFFTEGLAVGEPIISAFAPHNQSIVRSVFGGRAGILFADAGAHYASPATAIRRYSGLLADYVAAGAAQVRLAGDVPHPGLGAPWDWWGRYEAAVNRVWDDFPVWGLCPYDTRTTPGDVLDEVRRTHPRIATTAGQHHANPDFVPPEDFMRDRAWSWRDPVEDTEPLAYLTDPAPATVRATVVATAPAAGVPANDVRGMTLAATEAVTNAIVHGVPPVEVRVWAAPGRIVVAVTDHGPGLSDPLAGLRPTGAATGGLGLWVAHQVCAFVSMQHRDGAFTVRLVAGRPHP
ncbi:anti-sigma factor RsbA family regulatory protein [Dactylosporangium sp. NPDC000555]|uniref:anti-sigma factor RsbA family regulatory protein n=1 Tax=Dactylosporangium sp. NPDC000555 TaxID=3154260 RepID=UPI00333201FB